jgi:hypothetical protein
MPYPYAGIPCSISRLKIAEKSLAGPISPPPSGDFISMLSHGEATKNMTLYEYLGNLLRLTAG